MPAGSICICLQREVTGVFLKNKIQVIPTGINRIVGSYRRKKDLGARFLHVVPEIDLQ